MDPSQGSVTTSQEEDDERFWSQFCETVHYHANSYTDATITCKEGNDGLWQQVALREQAPDAHIKSILEVTHNPFTRLPHGSYAYSRVSKVMDHPGGKSDLPPSMLQTS